MSFLRRRLPLPLPLGARFEPSDAVLISSYLSPKIRKEGLAWDVIGFSDEVYDKPPWDFCTDSTAVLDDEKHYFFTLLKRGKNRVLRSVGPYGTWHESSTKKIYDSGSGKTIIGFNKLLNFRVKGEGKEMTTTDWLMHEFSVAEKGSDLVLCVIYKKNKKKEERALALALALERPPSVVVDSGILGSPKSVFDQVDIFDGIDDTDMGGQDPYDGQDPVVDSGILGSPKSVFDQLDFFDGIDDTDMGSQGPYDDQDPVVDSGILGSPKSVFDRLDFFDDTGMGGQDPYDDQDPVVDSGILGSPNSVFDQLDFFDGIDDTDMGGQDPYDDQDPVVDSGILGSPKSVFDQLDFFDDTGMGGQDPYDDQDPFDESLRFAAIDGHSQFQVLDSQEEGLPKKMGSEVEGFDEAEVEGDFDPLSFLNLLDSEEDTRPSKKMRCDFSDRIFF
ncbi:hypothetical protein SO802_032232 [Lithocarpus litseifolius]|uniref:NAC domain-containing protein n=1 Tax=Lithocarpus litseifolius TaxID=425828 RepID=A0AAW2BPM3_9ROSI